MNFLSRLRNGVFLAVACGLLTSAAQAQHPLAPDFALKDIQEQPLSLAQLKGQVVLLNFWTTSCPVCRAEIPTLKGLQSTYGDRGFRVIGVAVDENSQAVRDFYNEYQLNYPVATASSRLEAQFGGDGFPASFLIGRDQRIYSKHSGGLHVESAGREIDQLLAGRATEELTQFQPAADSEAVALPTNAEFNSAIPGVDVSGLTGEKLAAYKQQLAAEPCPCGCHDSVLACRMHDKNCTTSRQLAREALKRLRPETVL